MVRTDMSLLPAFAKPVRSQPDPVYMRGFTLIELMIGMAVGLISTLAITQIMLSSESQKRMATSGSDAQVSGLLAITTLRQNIQMAGYGFATESTAVGCPLEANYNGAAIAGFPANLVPVVITDGVNGAPDSIRLLSSTKDSFSVPVRIIPPGYDPASASFNTAFPVASVRGIANGDLMVAITDSTVNCQVFQVTADPGGLYQADRGVSNWNLAGFPSSTYGDGTYLINLGRLSDITYTVSALGTLQANTFALSATSVPSYSGAADIFGNTVNLQAYYGKDTDGDGAIDTWDVVLPTSNALWKQVLAVRVAIVSRSNQYEKEEVTQANLLWDVGANSTIAGAATCGSSKCLTLKIDGLADWKHYRYKLVDSVIPLRNMIWMS